MHQSSTNKYHIVRFTKSQRITHIFVILSFIMLALTGMMLKFAGYGVGQPPGRFIGWSA